ncbi:uncharacterized protein TM35_000063930 [Trypanosoma theileri]|uniref:Uncharacterized protein n=1 Tax=Trypanosoma theileri TaxID=67003 RepID=A0A1X0P3K3_9TRYP|nr:uncharacterized protein TM35_000063930 [Trypanosoma theileri]ORC91388.1 hypothetical protein TM35_000063930 [Trypanosoma theileri]
MQPSALLNRQERELASEAPVLINVSRAEAQLQRELDQSTAERRRVEERQHVVFVRERAFVRSRVDREMEALLHGVAGVVPPSVIEPPILQSKPANKQSQSQQEGRKGKKVVLHEIPASSAVGKATGLPYNQKQQQQQQQQQQYQHGKMYVAGRDPAVVASPRKEMDELPRGFPIPFEDSGFQCVIQWAETSFQEVLLTALGPRSVREQRRGAEKPNRLLVSVACHLLNEVLSRDSKYSILWPLLRQVIFEATFTPGNFQSFQTPDFSDSTFSYSPFKNCHDFVNLHLWSNACISERKENVQLSQRILHMQDVVRKSHLVLRLAQRRVDRVSLEHTFRAWRTTTRRTRAFREAAMAYLLRVRRRIQVEGCFLRWRRIATQSHVASLVKMLKESELRVAFLENANNTAVDTLSKKLLEEQRNNEILKKRKEALKSQLAENHVLTLRTMHNELRQLQYNVLTAKKNAKRWERLAKTYTCQTKIITVSSTVRKSGLVLRRVEDEFVSRAVTAKDRLSEARQCLETFLLDWVNLFMRNSTGGVFWHAVSKIDTGLHEGDFGPTGLLKLVRALESLYIARGAKRMVYFPSAVQRETDVLTWKRENASDNSSDTVSETLFKEVKRVLYLQTAEGLFPSLLTHCSFLNDFFTPALFCKFPHPTAMLWVLATLFIGYVRTVGGGPVTAEQDVDSRLRCRGEDRLNNYVVDVVNVKDTAGTAERNAVSMSHTNVKEGRTFIVSNDTVLKKNARSFVRRRTFIRKPNSENGDVDGSQDGERLVDTLSDLEVYLGLDNADDESSSSDSSNNNDSSSSSSSRRSSRSSSPAVGAAGMGGNTNNTTGTDSKENVKSTANGTQGDGTPSDLHSNMHTPGISPKPAKQQIEMERRKRVKRKAHLIPPVSTSLTQATQREYVQLHQEEKKQRRIWAGLARVVCSLIVRFHILDLTPSPTLERKKTTLNKKPVALMPLSNTSGNVSTRFGSAHRGQRRSVRLMASSRSMDNSSKSFLDKQGESVTLRRWLEDAKGGPHQR